MNEHINPTTRIDNVGAIRFIGESTPGTPVSAAGHRISRMDTTTGNVTCAGTGDFDQVWANHITLDYA